MGYNILINAPKSIPLTRKEFKELSILEYTSVFINYPVVFHYTDEDDLKLYTNNWNIAMLGTKNWRFKNIDWYENSSLETYTCIIPKSNELYGYIQRKLNHLIMK